MNIKKYLQLIKLKRQDKCIGERIKPLIEILKKAVIIILGISMILVVPMLLIYAIVKLWVYDPKGVLKFSDEIGHIISLLGGYLGFLGAILGVLGAYYIFTKEYRNIRNQAINKLYSVLSYSLEETEGIMNSYVRNVNDHFIITRIGNGILTNDNRNTFIQNYEKFSKISNDVMIDKDDKEFFYKRALNVDYTEILKDIIYDEQLVEYLQYVDSEEKKTILKWINVVKDYECKLVNLNKVKNTYKNKALFHIVNDKEAKDIYYYHQQIIYSREEIVKIINKSKKYNFKTLQQYHTERISKTIDFFLKNPDKVNNYIEERLNESLGNHLIL